MVFQFPLFCDISLLSLFTLWISNFPMYSHTLSPFNYLLQCFSYMMSFFLKNKYFFLLFFYSTVLILTTWMSAFVALPSFIWLTSPAPLGISLGSEFYVNNKQYIDSTFLKLKINQLEGSKHRVFL